MALIALALLFILAVAGLIVLFVAYPHQGKDIPRAEWLTDTMNKGSHRVTEYVEGRRATSHE